MTAFTDAMATWQNFYILMGTAAVTFIGLLFVAVSVNVEGLHRKLDTDLQVFSVVTFNCFFYVFGFAVVFLVPGQSTLGLGLPLLLLGSLGFLNLVRQYRRDRGIDRSTIRIWGGDSWFRYYAC